MKGSTAAKEEPSPSFTLEFFKVFPLNVNMKKKQPKKFKKNFDFIYKILLQSVIFNTARNGLENKKWSRKNEDDEIFEKKLTYRIEAFENSNSF